jgi:hypothetical protein
MRNWWNSLQDSAKAAEPYYGRLLAYYLLILFCPVLVFFWIGFLIPIGVLIATIMQLDSIYQKHRPAFLFMTVASPFITIPVLSIVFAILGYMTGTGCPQGAMIIGADYLKLPWAVDRLNIEPVTRRPMSGSLFSAVPLYFLSGAPYNAILMGLSRSFGPMPGAYRGPYPSSAAASEWLAQHGNTWTQKKLDQAEIRLAGMQRELKGSALIEIINNLPQEYSDYWQVGGDEITLALYSPECLLAKYSNMKQHTIVVLIDLSRQRIFARYPGKLPHRSSQGLSCRPGSVAP